MQWCGNHNCLPIPPKSCQSLASIIYHWHVQLEFRQQHSCCWTCCFLMQLPLDQYLSVFFHYSYHLLHPCLPLPYLRGDFASVKIGFHLWSKANHIFKTETQNFPPNRGFLVLILFLRPEWSICRSLLVILSLFFFPVQWKSDSVIVFISGPTDREMQQQHVLDWGVLTAHSVTLGNTKKHFTLLCVTNKFMVFTVCTVHIMRQ